MTEIYFQKQTLKCSVTDLNNKIISLITSKATDREEKGKNIQTLTPDLEHFIAKKFVGGDYGIKIYPLRLGEDGMTEQNNSKKKKKLKKKLN